MARGDLLVSFADTVNGYGSLLREIATSPFQGSSQ